MFHKCFGLMVDVENFPPVLLYLDSSIHIMPVKCSTVLISKFVMLKGLSPTCEETT